MTSAGIFLGIYPQSLPNTTGVASVGPFDGNRAFADPRQIVAFGPRPLGSQAIELYGAIIIRELFSAGVHVDEDTLTVPTPIGSIPTTNVVATVPGTAPSVVIIGGHYDPKRMPTPFIGANDGGASAAFLIKLARLLARESHRLTYWVVYFDGEEALAHGSRTDRPVRKPTLCKTSSGEWLRGQIKAVILVDILAQMWPGCGPGRRGADNCGRGADLTYSSRRGSPDHPWSL